jgi:hypothetical protein
VKKLQLKIKLIERKKEIKERYAYGLEIEQGILGFE